MGDGETFFSWGNTVRTRSGSHVLGVREAVRAAGFADVPHLACVSVFVPQPRFSSPLKDVLNNPEIRTLLRDHVTVALRRLVEGDEFALGIENLRDTLARRKREDVGNSRKSSVSG
jgi:DNA gyrase/topoisomerase IV subunit B